MKPILIVAVITAVVGVGAYAFSQNMSQPDSKMQNNVLEPEAMEEKQDGAMMDETDKKQIVSSRYVEYSETALEEAATGRRVLFFYASWCPTCKPADESFTQNVSKIPNDVTLIRVNYNDSETDLEEKDLAKKYGITYQHTFVQIDSTGKEVTKWNGGQIEELLSNSR